MQVTRWRIGTVVDEQSSATVFEQELAATTARGDGFRVTRHDRHGAESPSADSCEVAHERAFRAECQTVARVFDIRAYDEASVGRVASGADVDS